MNTATEYGCFRYFLVPYEEIQTSLLQKTLPNKKALIENIIDNTETQIKLNENTYDGKYKLYLVNKINSDLYLLQLGKHSSIKRSEDTGSGFEDSNIDNHPYIHIFINTKEQILLFEKKTKAFKSYKASANALSKYIIDKVEKFGYEFKYEEITSPMRFWNLIDKSTSLSSLTLNIYSPNLFDGVTPAEQAAKDLESATNSTENILTFRNKHGKLNLIKDKIKTFIDYVSAGGGYWFIRADVPGKNKKIFSSKDTTKTVVLPKDIVNHSSEALNNTIPDVIDSVNHKPGDDNLDEEKN